MKKRLGERPPLATTLNDRLNRGMCDDVNNGLRIVFIKGKKVGGSTLAGIFRGVAARRSMNVLYPAEEKEWLKRRNETCFDLMANHAKRLGQNALKTIIKFIQRINTRIICAFRKPWQDMAFPNALKFTIVRHPWGRALSGFYHRSVISITVR